jgi:hypothetical protein
LVYTPGAHTLCRHLKQLGCKMAVISGGFIQVPPRPVPPRPLPRPSLAYSRVGTV